MSLQLILGSSGSGKTAYMLKNVIEKSEKNPGKRYLLLVPEQFTMETQKNVVAMHPRGGSFDIDILSFIRLAEAVFEEVGAGRRTVLDDTGKSLVLRKVIRHEKEALTVFGGKIKKTGFVEEMKSVLSEFYQYGIDREVLESLCENNSLKPLLRAKLTDVKKIFQAFQAYIGKDYIPSEELLKELCSCVSQSQIIRDSEIYLDGFTGFTPVQYRLLELLMKYAKKVVVSLTLPEDKVNETRKQEQELFLLSIKTKERLLHIASEQHTEMDDPVVLKGKTPVRFKQSGTLAFLEKNIFRYSRDKYEGRCEDIKLRTASNPEEEVVYAVETIHKLVREEGCRYRDIAIVTGDMEMYYRTIERECRDGKIPCFIDHKRSILSNPLVEVIRSVIQILVQDFSYEAVFRYLKTGMTDLTMDEVDRIENVVLAAGIRGYHAWSCDWEKAEEEINAIRKKVIAPFTQLKESLKEEGYSVKALTSKLYEFLLLEKAEEKMNSMVEKFQLLGNLSAVREYSQIYPLVMDLFDKMVELMGEEEISMEEYGEILDSGFEEIKVGIIPPSMDCVMVGDIQRTRLHQVKALFILGVNDGIIPKKESTSGLLTESDRRELSGLDIELAPSARENAFIQKFYLYLNMTKPENKLYLSYTWMNHEGKAMRPSYLINEVKKLYRDLEVAPTGEKQEMDFLTGKEAAFSYLADSLREMDKTVVLEELSPVFLELYSYFYGKEEYSSQVKKLVEASGYHYRETFLDKAVARALYGRQEGREGAVFMDNSISRLEKFAACAYSHFLTYGLSLKERKIYEVKVSDLGTIYHGAIEIFSNMVNEQYSWNTLKEHERRELVQKSVEQAVMESEASAITGTARNRYLIERVKNMTDKTTQVLCNQVKKGKFVPSYFEMEFSPRAGADSMCLKIDEQASMRLRGIVDRVDLYRETDEKGNVIKVYVKVIDYKSGNKEFKIQEVEDGRQLQLSIYMCAVMDMERKKNPGAEIIPAAELYYNLRDPYLDKYNEDGVDDSKERREQAYRMFGLVNGDEEILGLIDEDISEKGTSTVISVSRNKNGNLKLSNATSTLGFQKLEEFLKNKVCGIGRKILEGDVSVHPYQDGTKNPCGYCEYASVCRFDSEIEGYEYRNIKKQKPEDVWKRITEPECGEEKEAVQAEEEETDNEQSVDKTPEDGN